MSGGNTVRSAHGNAMLVRGSRMAGASDHPQ